MSQAFKCDRCREFFEGPGLDAMSLNTSWMPNAHSHKVQVDVKVHRFMPRWEQHSTDPQLCSFCFVDVIALALNTGFKRNLTVALDLDSEDNPKPPRQGVAPCPVCTSYTCMGESNPNCPPTDGSVGHSNQTPDGIPSC